MAGAGALFRCEAEFATLKATACQFARSEGFAPSSGWIDLNLKDLKRIRIVPKKMPWRSVNGVEFDGGISIRTWKNFRSRATVTGDRPPIPPPSGGGVPHFSDLVLRTFKGQSGDVIDEIRYKDIYVDSTGIEEVTRGLANIQAHNSGIVRVPLTDIRKYYRKLGPFFGQINARMKSGKLLPTGLNGGSTWTFEEVVDYLFSQLPGSPAVDPDSDFRGRSYDDPVLEGEGEPVVEHLEKLLDGAGLKAQMLPDGNYTVSRRYSTVLSVRDIPDSVGRWRTIAEIHYERAAAAIVDRPPAVWAVGPRIVRRGSFPYVAVLQDLDGRYYTIGAICRRWGYSIGSLNAQVFSSSQTRFNDVPPNLGPESGAGGDEAAQDIGQLSPSPDDGGIAGGGGPAGGDGGSIEGGEELHFKRQDILKQAYKIYAPAFLLSDDQDGPLNDPETVFVPYLPLVKAAWYKHELSKLSEVPKDEGGAGDLDEYILLGPVIRGQTVAMRYMRNFEEFRKIFDARSSGDRAVLANYTALNSAWERALSAVVSDFLAAQKGALSTLQQEKLAQFGVAIDETGMELGNDRSVAREMGELMPESQRETAVRELLKDWGYDSIKIAHAKVANEGMEDWGKKVAEWAKKFQTFREIYEKRIAIPCRYNTPQQVLGEGVASIDARTGILSSSVPLAVVDQPFFFSGDAQTVIGDGAVVVTFGYELKGSEMECWTNFLFDAVIPDDPAEDARPNFAGSSRSSPIKAETVRMKSRMYQMDNGTPVNYNECWSEAKSKASSMLAQPAAVEGMTYELIGLRKAVLYAGVNSVQHELEGLKGMTHVSVNAPGARGPLGAADFGSGRGPGRRGPGVTRAELRETLPPGEAP